MAGPPGAGGPAGGTRTARLAAAGVGLLALLGTGAMVAAGLAEGPAGGSAPPPPAPAQAAAAAPAPADAPDYPVAAARIVARYPHDRTAFTEGLLWLDGALYESVGREGQSDVRRVDLATGRAEKRAAIPPAQFGEGLAAYRGRLVSLTWHDGVAHLWDARTLKRTGTRAFEGEGWGLAALGSELVQSDGTPTLRFLDPETLKVRRRVQVTARGLPLKDLNELEAVDGQLLANVWHQPFLVRIDPATGRVTGAVDLRAVVAEVGAADPEAVANGIAWDAKGRRLFVTGKLWPTLYEVRVDWPS